MFLSFSFYEWIRKSIKCFIDVNTGERRDLFVGPHLEQRDALRETVMLRNDVPAHERNPGGV